MRVLEQSERGWERKWESQHIHESFRFILREPQIMQLPQQADSLNDDGEIERG